MSIVFQSNKTYINFATDHSPFFEVLFNICIVWNYIYMYTAVKNVRTENNGTNTASRSTQYDIVNVNAQIY